MKVSLNERMKLLFMLAVFLIFFYLPVDLLPFRNPVYEALALLKWYAREHVLLCLVPAFFIAGAISIFVSQAAILKYFGARANKFLSYGVASISGTILAVCSCTVLPLFSSIYRRGAGLGPATAFLYSGPAINVLAIIMTARILGWRLGLARAVGAVIFSIVIGFLMHLFFLKEERLRHESGDLVFGDEDVRRPLRQDILYFAALVGILVFANWSQPPVAGLGLWTIVFHFKWFITGLLLLALLAMLKAWFAREELTGWVQAAWTFAKQIFPLLLVGVLVSGLMLGRPGHEGLIPSRFIAALVGGNSLFANLFASVVAAFMYFATLTEVPILQGLIGSGMGQGPALALLLAGPALSLPSMLVLRSILGTKKTVVYVLLVIVLSTLAGLLFGALSG